MGGDGIQKRSRREGGRNDRGWREKERAAFKWGVGSDRRHQRRDQTLGENLRVPSLITRAPRSQNLKGPRMEKTSDRQFANLRCIEYAAPWKLTEIMMLTNFIVTLKTLSEFLKTVFIIFTGCIILHFIVQQQGKYG